MDLDQFESLSRLIFGFAGTVPRLALFVMADQVIQSIGDQSGSNLAVMCRCGLQAEHAVHDQAQERVA